MKIDVVRNAIGAVIWLVVSAAWFHGGYAPIGALFLGIAIMYGCMAAAAR